MIKKEVVVIGAGPAGLAAAIEAARTGLAVLVIDNNNQAGGQLFKQIHKFFGSSRHQAGIRGIDIGNELLAEASKYSVEIWLNSTVIGLFKEKKIAVETGLDGNEKAICILEAKKIIIATGASENAVAFKGWTLPGVITAGAAQTMVNINRVLPGRSILMIGSGNVGLIVSYQLMQGGAEIIALVEAGSSIGGYAVHASKITRAGVPIYTKHIVLEARGKKRIEEATICQVDKDWKPIVGTEKKLKVDIITIAAGLKPLTELAMMHDCKHIFSSLFGGWIPIHSEGMETTIPGIYVAGDIAGVEEANTALEEGRLAGIGTAEALGSISQLQASLAKDKVWHRLNGLRSGPHGKPRLDVKLHQIAKYKEFVNHSN